jgi:D-alanine--poly(phosphoribitol) ligase subunit 1
MLQTNVLEYLEGSALRFENKIAFADDKASVTFGQMRRQAMGLGTCLAAAGGPINRPVAVLIDRTACSLTAMQGVLYSGNYYVPIDNKMPVLRAKNILQQVGARALVYAEADRPLAEELSDCCPLVSMEAAFETPADEALLARCRSRVLDVDPVYVLFTSGSTGAPKGIVISHRSVIDFTEWMTAFCGYTSEEVFGNQAPFYFDLSVKDVYQTLKLGATCHIYPKKFFMFPLLLVKAMEADHVTAINWATSAFHLAASSGALEKCAPASLKKAALGGEALQAKHVNAWKRALPELHVINLYGPTEVTVDCTGYHLDRDFADDEPIPLGTACANKEILLLDDKLQPVQPGQSGEICVRGSGLAKGYFGDWDKTNAAFVQNPASPHYPDLIYRTGDMAVERDGLLYFLARKDGQIKHMGYRIELGEIEVALHGVDGIAAAACLYDGERDRIICVYAGEPDSDALAKAMRRAVPKYMLPNVYVKLDQLPYNANGKVDRVLLKERYLHGAG